jgi:Bifunctional DNA primase/polymerase, N-terminal
MQTAFTNIQTQFERHALTVSARAEVKPLTGVQEYAINLYERGFNVFPIPSVHDWKLRGGTEKTPYKLEPLFRNRLHYVKDCECSTCRRYNFVSLFENSNIALMCGATSGNLLSIDCDSQEAFKDTGDKLTWRGLPFWAFTSHKGGQYLLRVIEGEAANIPQEKGAFTDVQAWGNRHFVVIPPSIHPKGTVYKWLSPEPLNMLPRETLPAVSVTALDWLGVTLKKYRKSANENDTNGLPEYAINLSHASRKTLKHGAKQGGRNSALVALAADLAGVGLTEDEAESALRMAADNCTPVYNDSDHKIEPILKWAFSEYRFPSRTYQKKTKNCVQDWQRAQKFEDRLNWYDEFGGKGVYARRVYHACIERAKKDSRYFFRASARDIAIPADMNKDTVSDYLNYLVDEDFLIAGDPEKSGARTFAFARSKFIEWGEYDESTDTCNTVQYSNIDILLYGNERIENNTLPVTDAERNAFHGLGVYAFSIWRNLLGTPAKSAYAIAKWMKLSETTVRNTVKRLVLAGLVSYSQSESLYVGNAMTDAQLERIAADRGTQNRTEDRRAQFTTEREKYANCVIAKGKDWYKKQSLNLSCTISIYNKQFQNVNDIDEASCFAFNAH